MTTNEVEDQEKTSSKKKMVCYSPEWLSCFFLPVYLVVRLDYNNKSSGPRY